MLHNKQQIEIKFIDIGRETKEIKELLNEGIIKYFDDNTEPIYIYLAENEKEIVNKIENDYDIYNIIEQLDIMFDCKDMEVSNIYGNDIDLDSQDVISLINDDLYTYISEEKQKEIFNAKKPSKELTKIFTEIGRNQLKLQIKQLLKEISKAEFI